MVDGKDSTKTIVVPASQKAKNQADVDAVKADIERLTFTNLEIKAEEDKLKKEAVEKVIEEVELNGVVAEVSDNGATITLTKGDGENEVTGTITTNASFTVKAD